MICSNCSYENDNMARFCSNCGTELRQICQNCGTSNEPAANFCSNCGFALEQPNTIGERSAVAPRPSAYTPKHLAEKILRERNTISGERRTVTVLFVDEVGSTAIGERLDPEDLYTITQAALGHMMDAVHLYEGTVTQFRGDGIMALFGAPIAHEDAARRAVGAALEMQRALGAFANRIKHQLGIDLRFRVGLNTGRVVVGNIGTDLDMEFTALGDTVNLAARMEGTAEPGTIYVSESTYRATQDYFLFEPVGQLRVKGKSEPILAFKAVGEKALRTRFEAAVDRGLSPYVGRQPELALLQRRFDQITRGRGQVILISGEAGIGKSRLLLEFHNAIKQEARWLEGQCLSFGKHIPYQPVIDIVQQVFHIEETDSEARIIQRVEEATAGMDQETAAAVPYLKALLSVDTGEPTVDAMDPRARRANILDGIRMLLLQVSRQQPLVLVVEDLHWIDEQSELVLKTLLDIVAASPILMILTYRPGYRHTLGERTYFDRLSLSELPAEQSAVLAQSILHQTKLPRELVSLIATRGDGNPFYIEEITKSLCEEGVLREENGGYVLSRSIEDISIPNTIQEIILSRIDRLQDEARSALQLASVIGREFTARLLKRISTLEAALEDVLAELKTLELIYQEAYFPELSYMFKHALTQDVAYRTLLRERRKALHRLIGAAIEELYTDRLAEYVEMLAHHYYQGEDWAKALEYLEKAGDKAAATASNQDALSYYERALEVSEQLGHSSLEIAAGIARKRAFVNANEGRLQEAVTDFDQMRLFAKDLGDRRLEGIALSLRGWMEMLNHEPVASERSAREALAIAGDDFIDIRYLANRVLALTLIVYGRHAEANSHLKISRELEPAVDDPFIRDVFSKSGLNSASDHWEGRFDDALEFYADSDDINYFVDLFSLWFKGLALGGKGEYEKSLDLLQQLLAAAERIGESFVVVRILNTVGWIYGELQDPRQAMAWNRRSLKEAQEATFPDLEVESNGRLNLADNLLALDRLPEAEEQLRIVGRIIEDSRAEEKFMQWRYAQHYYHSYGELNLIRGDVEKALANAEACLALAEESNSRKNIVKGRRLRGQALMALGQLAEAEEELSSALDMAQKVGNPTQLWQTHAALGDLETIREHYDAAEKSYQHATEVIQQVADKLSDPELRETFLASTAVRKVVDKSKRDS